MPANAVKTERDERLWREAKKQAKKQGKTGDYAYIMGIYQRMKGMSKADVEARILQLLEKDPKPDDSKVHALAEELGIETDDLEEKIYAMLAQKLGKSDKIPGGLAAGKRPEDFDKEALEAGIKVEFEHTSDRKVAQEIAMDHLTEDSKYYEKLAEMEAKKSLTAELDDWLEKAKKPIEGQMGLFAPRTTMPVSKKPPAGFQPIRGSKAGGYFKMQGGKRVYWYPGYGVSKKPPRGTHSAAEDQVIERLDMEQKMAAAPKAVDESLWTTENKFGAAGGPKEHRLTDKGLALAAKVATNLPDKAVAALEALSSLGGGSKAIAIEQRKGARHSLTSFGKEHATPEGLQVLVGRGLVESVYMGVPERHYRLTDRGKRAIDKISEEREYLLSRVRSASKSKEGGAAAPEKKAPKEATPKTAEGIAADIAANAKPGMKIGVPEVAYSYLGSSSTSTSPVARAALELLVQQGRARVVPGGGKTKTYEIVKGKEEELPRHPKAPRGTVPDPTDPRGGHVDMDPDLGNYYWHPKEAFEGKPATPEELAKMKVAQELETFEDEASIALAEGRGVEYSLDNMLPRERKYAQGLLDEHKRLGIDSDNEKRRWRSIAYAYEQHLDEAEQSPSIPEPKEKHGPDPKKIIEFIEANRDRRGKFANYPSDWRMENAGIYGVEVPGHLSKKGQWQWLENFAREQQTKTSTTGERLASDKQVDFAYSLMLKTPVGFWGDKPIPKSELKKMPARYVSAIIDELYKGSFSIRDLVKANGGAGKPPAGFTPITGSSKGGYHMKRGAGYVYWYPGQGIVNQPHPSDEGKAPSPGKTPGWKKTSDGYQMEHNGKTATIKKVGKDFVLNYDGKDHKLPPKSGFDEAEGKLQEISPIKPEEKKEAKPAAKEGKPEGKKEAKPAESKPEQRQVITDPAELPEGFNDLDKKQRAVMTADYDTVVKEMTDRFGEPRKYKGDLKNAIGEHLDELGQQGYIIPKNVARAKEMLNTMVDHGVAAGIDKAKLATLMEENVRKLAHQEIEAAQRTLGDHGVRHLSVNAKQSDAIFEQLKKGGKDISPMDHFMAYQVWMDHDMGYTIPAIARGGFAVKDNYHPQASTVMGFQQRDKMTEIFGKDGFDRYIQAVANHSGSEVDWKQDYFGSAVRLADNTHLFADKMPEVLFDSKEAVETMVKIRLAIDYINGENGKDRTPEQKAKLKAMIGGVRNQLIKAIESRDDLPHQSKEALAKAAREIGELTPKFLIGRLAGRNPKFDFDGKEMKVVIEQSEARQTIGEVFGDDQADQQFAKLLKDYGVTPEKALSKKPPPPGAHIGDNDNGIGFTWTPPTNEHHAEKTHADVMKAVKSEWDQIQKMQGQEKESAINKFFGADIAKAMVAIMGMDSLDRWLEREPDDFEKSAMSAMAARTGRARPSAYAPIKGDTSPKKPGLGTRIASKLGMKPSGGGWQPIPGGGKGGYRKMGAGGKWLYWYPGMKEGGSEKEAETHQAKMAHAKHMKESSKWRERAAKRREQGQPSHAVESAMDKMRHHANEARKLAEKHGFRKGQKMDKSVMAIRDLMKSKKVTKIVADETEQQPSVKKGGYDMAKDHSAADIDKLADKVMGGSSLDDVMRDLGDDDDTKEKLLAELRTRQAKKAGTAKSMVRVGIGEALVELGDDEAIAKSLEAEDGLQIGVQARHIGPQNMQKGTIYQGEATDQPSPEEDTQRQFIAATIVENDPAGHQGQGGLPEWWSDAYRGQPDNSHPLVVKSDPGPTKVIDDSDPQVRRHFTKLD